MTIATVTTDINIGPFKIPANAQNMIMNNYAQRNNLAVELVIPEPFKSNALETVRWLHADIKLSKIIFSSIYQLPKEKKWINKLIKDLGNNVEFHFAIEGIKGRGKKFLKNCIKEVKLFGKTKIIDSDKAKWTTLFKMINNKKK